MERMELRVEELRVSSVCARSSTVDKCREPSDEPRHEHCGDQSHSRRGWVTAAKKLFHVLVMNVRGPALAVIRGITDMNGALAWRALITRYAPNTAPRVQCLVSAILDAKTFHSELTAYEIELDEWQENIRKWESTCWLRGMLAAPVEVQVNLRNIV